MFAKRYHFSPTRDPFAEMTHGPEWFTRLIPTTGEHAAESKWIWEAFLTPKLMSIRLGNSNENVKILCYYPNLVMRQFGIIQTVPRSFLIRKSELYLCTIDFSEDEYLQSLARHAADLPMPTSFAFQPLFYYNDDHDDLSWTICEASVTLKEKWWWNLQTCACLIMWRTNMPSP